MPTEQALTDAAQSVLEMMFFAESELAEAPLAVPEAGQVFMEIEFDGERSGRLSIEMPESCARAMAGNFEGVPDAGQIPVETVDQVAAEFVNMICGAALTRMDPHGLFALASPRVTRERRAAASPSAASQCAGRECWLRMPYLGEAVIGLALTLDQAVLEAGS